MQRPGQNHLIALALCLAACSAPPAAAPPPQMEAAPTPLHAAYAADPNFAAFGPAEIGPLEDNRFRWTGAHPAVHLRLAQTEALTLNARFWLPAEALAQTGPIEITYLVNGHELARQRYPDPGEHHFSQPVPAAWLAPGDNTAALAIDKTYQANGARLGIALVELGFSD